MSEQVFNFTQESRRVEQALRQDFPHDTIDTTEGYNGRVHLKVVSRRFNGMNERQKQQYVWEILNGKLGPEAQAVSLALVYGTDEL